MFELALYQPEIPHNTGTLMRMCACLGIRLNLIAPMGFALTDKHLKRAGLDYRDSATIIEHLNFESFYTQIKQIEKKRLVLLDTKGAIPLPQFQFQRDDVLMFGRESCGVPDSIIEQSDVCVYIPMCEGMRSLNLALSAAMVTSHAMQHLNTWPTHL